MSPEMNADKNNHKKDEMKFLGCKYNVSKFRGVMFILKYKILKSIYGGDERLIFLN